MKLVTPRPYVQVDMHELGFQDDINTVYDWAYDQDAYLPDGDGDIFIPMETIDHAIGRGGWIEVLWDSLPSDYQDQIESGKLGLCIHICQ